MLIAYVMKGFNRSMGGSRRGYTLLELLVVITVIAIIASIGLVSYASTSRGARDARRKGDLKAISNAMEQYYSICGFTYPVASGGKVPTTIACTSPAQTIMAEVPTDPSSGDRYDMTGGGATFTICLPNTPPLEGESTTPYCLTNLQ